MAQKKIVHGIIRSELEAARVIADLQRAGIESSTVSVALRRESTARHVAPKEGNGESAHPDQGPLALLASFGGAPSAEIGSMVIAGPLRLGADGSSVRSLSSALLAAGVPAAHARECESKVAHGNLFVSVETSDGRLIGESRRVLGLHGAYDVVVTIEPLAS